MKPEDHRHATWLELFFDVIFVVATAAVVHNFEEDLTLIGLRNFALSFLAIWWLWTEFSYYADLFDTRSFSQQVLTIIGMFGFVVLAVLIRTYEAQYLNGMAFAYIALSTTVLIMHALAWYYVKEWRDMSRTFMTTILAAIVIWTISIWIPAPYKYGFWLFGILVQAMGGPLVYVVKKNFPKHKSHMPERFGLFMIIILGEGVTAVVKGLDATRWDLATVAVAVLSFLTVVSVWKLYFYESGEDDITNALQDSTRPLIYSFYYGYSHYFIYGSVALLGVGLLEAILHAHTEVHLEVALLIHGSLGLYLSFLTLSQWAAPSGLPIPVVRARVGVVVLSLLLLLLSHATPILSLSLQTTLLFAMVFYEYYVNDFSYVAAEANEV